MAQSEHNPSIDGPQSEELSLSPSRLAILTVILHEGSGLCVPNDYVEPAVAEYSKANLPYAILNYEQSQEHVESLTGTAENPVWVIYTEDWYDDSRIYHKSKWKFDVCRLSELSIHLFLRDPHASPSVRSQDALLGVVKIAIDPSQVSEELSSQWVNLQDGTGQIRISLKYDDVKSQVLGVADFNFEYKAMGGRLGHSGQAVKKDTKQKYTTRTIPTFRRPENTDHPFIVPLALVFQSQEGLHIFSPTMVGGYLFHHLQRERCFNLESARFYSAEILCALEYLHDARGIYSWLKPQNVLLDSLGHVVLCGSSVFHSRDEGGDHGSYGMPEYPAPELLLGQGPFRAADWWTLGIFLYEMLTGLPPFFDENPDEICRKILNPEPVQIPEAIPLDAREIITRLLDREPGHRLGAKGGAAEVKAHPFFSSIDWTKLLQRKHKPPFKPDFSDGGFTQHGVQVHFGPAPRDPRKDALFWCRSFRREAEPESNLGLELDTDVAQVAKFGRAPSVRDMEEKNDDGWELVWEDGTPGDFYFRDHATGEKKPVPATELDPSRKTNDAADSTGPSASQKQDALEAALKAGHDHIVSQIVLEYGIDLNVRLSGYGWTSPLEWLVDRENLPLVRLLLDHGADVNLPGDENRENGFGGPVIVRAVTTGNRKLVELLVSKKPDRVALTRAVGVAVDQRDSAMARLLLANGARCDFEDEDRPFSDGPKILCQLGAEVNLDEYIPPLVRAVKLGDVGMVRLLLEHGANPNVGYHDLLAKTGVVSIKYGCGRVIELAMELGRQETMKLLFAAGADIHVARPVWRVYGHSYTKVPRDFHQITTARLRAAAASAKKRNEAKDAN